MTGHHQFHITLFHTAVQTEKHNNYPAEFKLKQCKPRDQIPSFFLSWILDSSQCCIPAVQQPRQVSGLRTQPKASLGCRKIAKRQPSLNNTFG